MLENLFVNNKAPTYSDETIDIWSIYDGFKITSKDALSVLVSPITETVGTIV